MINLLLMLLVALAVIMILLDIFEAGE